jgi:phage terminase small subunit
MASKLTYRQERFCLQWFRHHGVGRRAYLAAGYRVRTPQVADAAASRLLGYVKVRERIQEIKAVVAKRAQEITLDTLIADLERIKDSALASGQHGPAVSAVTVTARLTGHLVDRKEVRTGDLDAMTDAELQAIVKQAASAIEQANAIPDNAIADERDIKDNASSASPAALPSPTHKPGNGLN